MSLENAVVLITGANRGLGLAFAKQALARGAKKVYAGARDASSVKLEGVTAVTLDVTKPAEIAALAEQLSDVTVVINNAGIARVGGVIGADAQQQLREHLDTNLFGILNLSQAFAPVLKKNGGGTVLNVLSALSWINTPVLASYATSKSAAWGLTNGLRHELRAQGTQVIGLHAGFIDTDMARGFEAPKNTPEDVARQAFDAIEGGAEEVFVDDRSRQLHQALSSSIYLKDVVAG